MSEARVYADGFQKTFASMEELIEFLGERARTSSWIRKPTKELRLVPLEKEVSREEDVQDEDEKEILDDTQRNTQLMLKMRGQSYPVRSCAVKTILDRAGVSGPGLRKLDKAYYSKVVNYCLKAAKGEALIKIADGKVSAVHGGDYCDYHILEMQDVFEMTVRYVNQEFKGSSYMEGSGCYDHTIVTAMWELKGRPELLETYQKAMDDHGINAEVMTPVLRLTTSDVAASGVNLYPLLLCGNGNQTISLGHPIKLPHKDGANLEKFQNNLNLLFSRYQEAITDISKLMDVEIKHPVNCLMEILKRLRMKKKIKTDVIELFEAQNGTTPCTAHDLYYALNEASFFAACEGLQGQEIIKVEEEIAKVLKFDWAEYDVYGSVTW